VKVTVKRAYRDLVEKRVVQAGETVEMTQKRLAEVRKALAACGYAEMELPAKAATPRPARRKAAPKSE